jgi:hypothetical protein
MTPHMTLEQARQHFLDGMEKEKRGHPLAE